MVPAHWLAPSCTIRWRTPLAQHGQHLMSTSRVDHTVTLLLNGEVLVTGGYSDTTNAQPSADIYFVANNVFNPVTARADDDTTRGARSNAAGERDGVDYRSGETTLTAGTHWRARKFSIPRPHTFTATAAAYEQRSSGPSRGPAAEWEGADQRRIRWKQQCAGIRRKFMIRWRAPLRRPAT